MMTYAFIEAIVLYLQISFFVDLDIVILDLSQLYLHFQQIKKILIFCPNSQKRKEKRLTKLRYFCDSLQTKVTLYSVTSIHLTKK